LGRLVLPKDPRRKKRGKLSSLNSKGDKKKNQKNESNIHGKDANSSEHTLEKRDLTKLWPDKLVLSYALGRWGRRKKGQ